MKHDHCTRKLPFELNILKSICKWKFSASYNSIEDTQIDISPIKGKDRASRILSIPDGTLNFDHHARQLLKKANKLLYSLAMISRCMGLKYQK